MPRLIESRSFRVVWGNTQVTQGKGKAAEAGVVHADERAMEQALASTLAEITDGGWEIRASLPLHASEFVGGAAGNAAGFTDGVVLICQRWREMDEATHDAEMRERGLREEAARLRRREAFLKANPVTEKKKLLGPASFQFMGVDYPSRDAAALAQQDAAERI
jgi:hypothetical protein